MTTWTKETVASREYGYRRADGFYVGQSPKKWWHLYTQNADGNWSHVAGGYPSAEAAMAAVVQP